MSSRAKALPDGSIIANRNVAWIKNWPNDWYQWRGTNGGYANDRNLDEKLAEGASILRFGWDDTEEQDGATARVSEGAEE